MKVEIRNGNVHLSGYINAVERFSKPITGRLHGKVRTFVERIRAGAFDKSLRNRKKVDVLINHDRDGSKITDTLQADCVLREDKIGLRFEITSSHPKMLEAVKRGFSGCSFGMHVLDDILGTLDGMTTRTITALDLLEVSILDTRKTPAYDGTMIETRAFKGGTIMEIRTDETANLTLREFIEKFGDEPVDDVINWLKSALNDETQDDNDDADDNTDDADTGDDSDNADTGDDSDDTDDKTDDADTDDDNDDETRSVDLSYFEERLNVL